MSQRFIFNAARIHSIVHRQEAGQIRSHVCLQATGHEIEFEALNLLELKPNHLWDIETWDKKVTLRRHLDLLKDSAISRTLTTEEITLDVDKLRISTHCQFPEYPRPTRWVDESAPHPITKDEVPEPIPVAPRNRIRKLNLT